MDEIDIIRDRINEKKKTNKIYNFIKGVLLICTLFLGFLIYAKNDANATLLNKIFNTNISFVKMNQTIDLFISDFLSNFNIFIKPNVAEETVSNNSNSYIRKNGNYFYTTSNYVESLNRGKVIHIEQENDKYNVVIFYQNEVTACYYDLISIDVSFQDIINVSDIIGGYENSFKVLFQKNGNLISYEEFLLL